MNSQVIVCHDLAQYAKELGPLATNSQWKEQFEHSKFAWVFAADSGNRILFVHLKDIDAKTARGAGKVAAAQLKTIKCEECEFVFAAELGGIVGHFENAFVMANYEQNTMRQEEGKPRVTSNVLKYTVTCSAEGFNTTDEYRTALAAARATETARRLAQTRATTATPGYMEERAREIAGKHKNVKEVRVLAGEQLLEQGMNLIHGVGKAATSAPRAVYVHYQGNPSTEEVDLVIVGKGVTYDTGGLSIKTASMHMMHGDKGGSCAVLGALQATCELNLEKNIVFACGFAENAVSEKAVKPGDILTAMNGLTVEVENTDAEGRLVMADTMTYAQRNWKPKRCMYIATLTGAVAMALGSHTAGFFTNTDDMAARVMAASEASFEAFWRLPITDEHRNTIKGQWGADINNMGASRFGGASKAAAFLECFIEEDRPWAHLDIANAIFNEKEQAGFGAKALLYLIKGL